MKILSAILIVTLLSGCAIPTVINSKPDGATVYINDTNMGKTPLTYSDKEIIFSQKVIRIEMAGYKSYEGIIKKDQVKVQPLIWGCIVGVPLLWALGYEEEYTYKLERGHSSTARGKSAPSRSMSEDQQEPIKAQSQAVSQSAVKKSEQDSSSQGSTNTSARMFVSVNKGKLRQKASTNATVIKSLKKGEEVQVIKQKDGWYLIELAGGESGWCHNSVLTPKN